MNHIKQKLLAILLIVCMLSTLPLQTSAADIKLGSLGTNISKSYWTSNFFPKAVNAYNNSKKLGLCDADRFVQVALSQVGYMASPVNKDYNGNGNGKIGNNKKPYTEYSRFMKKNGLNWCASYVSWVAKAAGISNNVLPTGGACGHWRKATSAGSKMIKIWSNDFKQYKDYKPKVGDLALYTGQCEHKHNPKNAKKCYKHYNTFSKTSHVGIVISVSNKKNKDGSWTFKTVERTTVKDADTVNIKSHTTKDTRGKTGTCKGKCSCATANNKGYAKTFQGFFHPKWADGKAATANATKNLSTLIKTSSPTTTKPSTTTTTTATKPSTTTTATTATKPSTTTTTYIAGSFDKSKTNYISTSKGSMAWPTNATYTAKLSITGTNAVVVANVKKTSGSSYTRTGMVLYDSAWNVLADKTFAVTNVSKTTTSFHTWFDINKELGVTLKPSKKYYYRIYGFVDGEKIATPHWGFTTASK